MISLFSGTVARTPPSFLRLSAAGRYPRLGLEMLGVLTLRLTLPAVSHCRHSIDLPLRRRGVDP